MVYWRPILLLLMFVLFFGEAFAEDQNPRIFVGTFFPFILEQDHAGKPKGLSVDILKKISERTGDQIEVVIQPWARALKTVEMGKAAGIVGPYKSKKRERFITYSKSHFYEDHMVLLSRSKKNITWQGDFLTLKDYDLLTVRGWAYGPEFEAARSDLKTEVVGSAGQAIQMLAKGRVDLIALNERNALYELRKEGLWPLIKILEPSFRSVKGYFGFSRSKNDEVFQARFNQALEELFVSGEIDRLSAAYGLRPISK